MNLIIRGVEADIGKKHANTLRPEMKTLTTQS